MGAATVMSNQYYVEVVAPDGLAHHIGPFEKRSYAREWMKQHSGVCPVPNPDISKKLTRQSRDGEQLL
jgi:hypothetical protein